MAEDYETPDYDDDFDVEEYIDNRITLNGRLIPTDDVEVLIQEEEHGHA